jgi:urea transport system substrate-binding protein
MTSRPGDDVGEKAKQAGVPDDRKSTVLHSDTPAPTKPAGPPGSAQKWVGRTIGKYRITAVLGQGGMGLVLKAHDPLIDREVAIKVLSDNMAADPRALARFLAEARAVGKLNHPNVCAVYDVFQEGGKYFLVMELVHGGTLDQQLESKGPMSVREATQALIDACRGTGAAHAAGLIHRDIKPGNLMRASDGTSKVMDFGLAKATAPGATPLTQTGMVLGTPYFMSPEQCEAKPLDGRADLYALGATYYTLLTGSEPYQHLQSLSQVLYAHIQGPIPDPTLLDPSIPQSCAKVIRKAMAKAPADRYQSAEEMMADLTAILGTQSGQKAASLPSELMNAGRRARRRLTLAVGGGIVAVLALVGFLWSGSLTKRGPSTAMPVIPAGDPIKVGILQARTGTMASSASVVADAVEFAIDEMNKAGGLLGRSLEPVEADTRTDAEVAVREARRLIADEKVCATFGCWTSVTRKAVKPIIEEYDHLLVYPVQYEGMESSPCIIYMGEVPNQQIIPAVEWAVRTMGKKRFYLVASDYIFPRAANEVIKDQLKRLGAISVGEAYLPLGSQNVERVLTAIDQTRPDMVLNTINGDSNIAFFRGLREKGLTAQICPVLSFSVGEDGLRNLLPADLEGHYAAWTYFQSIRSPENDRFVERFLYEYPQYRITDPMEAAYTGFQLWAKAVKETKSTDPKKVRRAMLTERLNAPEGEVRLDPDNQHCYKTPRIGQVDHDGHFQVVWTAPGPVAPVIYPNTRTAEQWTTFLHDLYVGWGNRWSPAGP